MWGVNPALSCVASVVLKALGPDGQCCQVKLWWDLVAHCLLSAGRAWLAQALEPSISSAVAQALGIRARGWGV